MTKEQCIWEAERIEANAADSLETWTILGQTDKYSVAMERASKLRHAATLRTPTERKQYVEAAL